MKNDEILSTAEREAWLQQRVALAGRPERARGRTRQHSLRSSPPPIDLRAQGQPDWHSCAPRSRTCRAAQEKIADGETEQRNGTLRGFGSRPKIAICSCASAAGSHQTRSSARSAALWRAVPEAAEQQAIELPTAGPAARRNGSVATRPAQSDGRAGRREPETGSLDRCFPQLAPSGALVRPHRRAPLFRGAPVSRQELAADLIMVNSRERPC